MNSELASLIEKWNKWDKNEKTRNEVKRLCEEENFAQLSKCMSGRLSFGTAGMRASVGAGFSRLNDLTVIQVAQGMLKYMQQTFPAEALSYMGIVIGYDARQDSYRFAQLIANIFLRNSCKVRLFSKIVPTPFVSFAILKYKCLAGVMVTASHNPKDDNGLKVYWSNGIQILSPHDANICSTMLENLEPWATSWDLSESYSCPHFSDPLSDLTETYFDSCLKFCYHKDLNKKCPRRFTYTPVHGVGKFYTPPLLEKFGFSPDNIFMVQEQLEPDPNFPTAPFPNPEEGESVLKPALKTADSNNSTIILANDPDADRFQLAEKETGGKWRIFTGNEIGALLVWWLWKNWRENHPNEPAEHVYVINSVVSSQMASAIAKKEGFSYEETLTGFKWLADRAEELTRNGGGKIVVLLCWEESIGYMPMGPAMDKDGVLTAALFAEYASYLHSINRTFSTQLDFLHQRYGYYLNFTSYYTCHDPLVTKKIFDKLRKGKSYPSKCGPYNIKYVRDLTTGYDNSRPDDKPILPVNSSSQMITFTLDDGSILTLRASGTEPKIKFYIEIIGKYDEKEQAGLKLEEIQKAVVEFLAPKANNLLEKI